MIISVISGKGGTGKTTVATNMAVSFDKAVTLLDCDVEEPNAHLFLSPVFTEHQVITTFVPTIHKDRCNGCKTCVEFCSFNALTYVGEQILVFPDLCHGCKGCELLCPEKAVSEASRELGSLNIGRSNLVKLVQGKLRVGEPMAPPLIRAVRKHTAKTGVTIIDAPPGTSCSMVASTLDTDFILFVSEPTPFGLHDLKYAFEAVYQMNIPSGLVINRADIGDRALHEFAEKNDLPILLEIPFDREIAKSYAEGGLIVEKLPGWKSTFQKLIKDITKRTLTAEVAI